MENNRLFPTTAGTPQGGIASPVLANLTSRRDGKRHPRRHRSKHDKVNFIRYADDSAVTAASKEILEQKVKPAVVEFLDERGLKLSEEKTIITHITEGFNFLGQNVRKYGQKLLIKPSRQSVRSVLDKARQSIKGGRGKKAADLIRNLNPVLRGWANYHRHVVSKRRFGSIDYSLHGMLWRWARREHRNKSDGWIRQRYFSADPTGPFGSGPGSEGTKASAENLPSGQDRHRTPYQGPGRRQPLRPRRYRVFREAAMFRLAHLSPW